MKGILIILCLLTLALSLSPCEPFGVRLNYGRSVYDSSNPERLGIRFNTHEQCSQIELLINKFMIVHCPIKRSSHYMLDYINTRENYTTYIHQCSLTRQIEYDTEIEYNLFDVAKSQKIFKHNIKIKIKNPHQSEKEFTFLHLADWGPITKIDLANRYESISASVVGLIKEGKIDCAIINGDIGYELNSNAEHHLLTMRLIEEVSSLVPIILNRGNHEEDKTKNSVGSMFNDYFQLYDLEIHNATGINIGPVFFAIIDPANMVIPRLYTKFTEESLYSSLESFKKVLEKARGEGRTIVALSHYPLVCGFPTRGHCIPDEKYGEVLPLYVNLKEFYTQVLKYRVPLVLAAHVHAYQRTYPFISGYRSRSRVQSSYLFNEEYFIQVVEGVAGSDNGLDEHFYVRGEEYIPPPYVASHSENCTGFGVFRAAPTQLKYEHFSLHKGAEKQLTDSFVIQIPKKREEQIQNSEL